MASFAAGGTATTTTTNKRQAPIITRRCKKASEVPACSATLRVAFADDAVLRYNVTRKLSQPKKAKSLLEDDYFMSLLFTTIVNTGVTAHGAVSSVSLATTTKTTTTEDGATATYPTVGIFMAPGQDPNHLVNYVHQLPRVMRLLWHIGPTISWRFLVTLPSVVESMKKRTFSATVAKTHDFYYIYFLGTRPEAQGQGLASAWLRQCQAEAAKAGKPIWLESSSLKSRSLYTRLGWRVADEYVFGKGLVDATGRPVVDGNETTAPGVGFWGMIWWPDGMDPLNKTAQEAAATTTTTNETNKDHQADS